MKCAVIHRPSEAALSLIARKVRDKALRDIIENGHVESIGICQGTVSYTHLYGRRQNNQRRVIRITDKGRRGADEKSARLY